MSEHIVAAAELLPTDGRWEPIGVGESVATVFHDRGSARFAKCVPANAIGELEAERDRSTWLREHGLPGAQVLDWRATDAGACQVTRAIPGVTADRLTPAELEDAWPAVVRVVSELHQLPVTTCPFDRRLDTMISVARSTVAQKRVQPEFLPVDLQQLPPPQLLARLEAQLTDQLAHEAHDLVVCHGDLCLPNIVVDPDSMTVNGLIDVGRLGRADPYADIALLLTNARETWPDESAARRFDRDFAEGYGIELDRHRLDFYLLLDPLTWPGQPGVPSS